MTKQLKGSEIAQQLTEQFPEAVIQSDATTVLVKAESLFQVASFLNSTPGLDFDLLECLTGVDYLDYFEVVYHLISISNNHSLILKTRCYGRENPQVPSVTSIWQGANFQERETYDLMGISFEGHPDLRRIYLWDGFPGHPLRRDYL
ncbi:NADH-quinone oxidoreductase subunit C [Chloroflexota bacterium]